MAKRVGLNGALVAGFLSCGSAWAIDTSALPSVNSDACNSLCQSWMEIGREPSEPVNKAPPKTAVAQPQPFERHVPAAIVRIPNNETNPMARHAPQTLASPSIPAAQQHAGLVASVPLRLVRNSGRLKQKASLRAKLAPLSVTLAAVQPVTPSSIEAAPVSLPPVLVPLPDREAELLSTHAISATASDAMLAIESRSLASEPPNQAEPKIDPAPTTIAMKQAADASVETPDRIALPSELDAPVMEPAVPRSTRTPMSVRLGFYAILAAILAFTLGRRRSKTDAQGSP